ncbi:hypothetical protein D3C75_178950 [compost metagenome]
MNPVIHKYTVQPSKEVQELRVPHGSKIVSAGFQNGQIVIWVMKFRPDSDHTLVDTLRYMVVGTGQEIDAKDGYPEFKGTVPAGPFIFHVFEIQDLSF